MSSTASNAAAQVLPQLQQLVTHAKSGDATVLPQLRDLLDDHLEIWQQYGSVGQHVEDKWLDLRAGDDPLVRESVKRAAEELREKLLHDGDSQLETLLVDRVVASWLMTRYFDSAISVMLQGLAARVRFLSQQLDKAQRRHAAAIKSLAEVRKLLPDAVSA